MASCFKSLSLYPLEKGGKLEYGKQNIHLTNYRRQNIAKLKSNINFNISFLYNLNFNLQLNLSLAQLSPIYNVFFFMHASRPLLLLFPWITLSHPPPKTWCYLFENLYNSMVDIQEELEYQNSNDNSFCNFLFLLYLFYLLLPLKALVVTP